MWESLSSQEWQALLLSVQVSLLAMGFVLPLALSLAYLLARRQFAGKALLSGLVHLPLVLPPVVTGVLLLFAFGRNGFIGRLLYDMFGMTFAFRWTGAALAAGIMALPLVVRPLRLSLEAVDTGLEEAAETLGARRARRFFTITLPLMMPGMIAAMVLGFAKAFGEFGATITFAANIPGETQTLALAIHTLLQVPAGETAVIRLTIIAIAISLIAVMASEWLNARLLRRLRS